MQFKVCVVCNLSLPISVMQPIPVQQNGKTIIVGICDSCKEKRIKKSKEKYEKNSN